jgi:hypothetical protein
MDVYRTLSAKTRAALEDLEILAGWVGASGEDGLRGPRAHYVTWQDVAGTASVNLRSLANALDSLRTGEKFHQGSPWTGPVVFPSPTLHLMRRAKLLAALEPGAPR